MLDKRVVVCNPYRTQGAKYGMTEVRYKIAGCIWAAYTPTKGARAMMHGEIEAYLTCMVRCDCHTFLNERSRLIIGKKCFVIDSFIEEKGKNEVQMVCHEVDDIDQDGGPSGPSPSPLHKGGEWIALSSE
jgi:hypothetical protein